MVYAAFSSQWSITLSFFRTASDFSWVGIGFIQETDYAQETRPDHLLGGKTARVYFCLVPLWYFLLPSIPGIYHYNIYSNTVCCGRKRIMYFEVFDVCIRFHTISVFTVSVRAPLDDALVDGGRKFRTLPAMKMNACTVVKRGGGVCPL